MKKSQMNLKENIKHWKKNIASIMIRDIYRALNATKTKLANIRRALEKEKEMSDKLTPCPCDKAPYPWCNNAEGCGSCPEYERWLEENEL